MASEEPSMESGKMDTVEAERKRKQRDLKRKSRERQKRNLLELQSTAQALELEYKQLIADRSVMEEQYKQQQSGNVAIESGSNTSIIEQSRLMELQSKYWAVRQEMHELREQMTGFKQKLEEYERFIAMLDGHLMGFEETQTGQKKPMS